MSGLCNLTNLTNSSNISCPPGLKQPEETMLAVRIISLIVCGAVMLTGICGNTLTLLTLSTAKHVRRRVSTLFVMNLSAVDLNYCVFAMPLNAITILSPTFWCDHEKLCQVFAYLRYSLAFLDWTSLALIAIERYAKIVFWQSRFYGIVFQRGVVLMAILFTWIFHFGAMLFYLEEAGDGSFGLNMQVERCDFNPLTKKFSFARQFFWGLWTFPVLFVIGLCYVHIFIFVRKQSKEIISFADSEYVLKSGIQRMRERDISLAKTLFLLVCSYTLCVVPVCIANIADPCDNEPNLQILAYCIYFPLYSINNLIYAVFHPEYRNAYVDLLSKCFPRLFRKSQLPKVENITPAQKLQALNDFLQIASHASQARPEISDCSSGMSSGKLSQQELCMNAEEELSYYDPEDIQHDLEEILKCDKAASLSSNFLRQFRKDMNNKKEKPRADPEDNSQDGNDYK